MAFAKLYTKENGDQILVTVGSNDDCKPQVLFSFVPEGLGICTAGPTWDDTDKGWDLAESFFGKVTEESATEFVDGIIQQFIEATS